MLNKLVEEIKQLSQEYYDTGTSSATDKEFDEKLEQVRKLDPNHPILKEVGHGYILKGIDEKEKFQHPIEVGSIEKTKETSKLVSFLKPFSTFSTKIDGNSVVVYYKNGNLFKVVTRGSDNIGIDRTAKFINKVPKQIPVSGYVAVRGEVAIKKENYTLENGFDISKSSRNAVAGAISRKDDWEFVFSWVDFIAYTFIDCNTKDDLYNDTDWSKLFKVEAQKPAKIDYNELGKFKKTYKDDYPYDADGVVFKTGSEYLAFKFDDEVVNTKLLSVKWSIGKDQRLTPVAILEPVQLAGATISKASLGSYAKALEKDCWPVFADHVVEISRANEIIPHVERTISKNISAMTIQDFSKQLPHCPVCDSIGEQNGEHIFCVNSNCENLNSSRLYTFSSYFYPEGLSEKIIEKFFESEEIYTVYDLIKYNKKFSGNVYGLGESHIEKINKFLENISGTVDVKIVYNTFLNSCGSRLSEKIVESGFNLLKFFEDNTEINKLNNLSNFNSNVISEIVDKKELFKKFVELKQIKQEKKIMVNAGKYVITGVRFHGDDLVKVETAGWSEASSVSKNTQVLVVKDPSTTSSKATKARELGIKILSVEEFLEYICA
jgi:DNA ligase (NAD+)